jgi:hypothetical protein
LLKQATALNTCSKVPLSAVTIEPAVDEVQVTCDVPSELYFYSKTVPGASVISRVRVIKTMMIVMMWGRFLTCPVEIFILKFQMLLYVGVKLGPSS